MPECMAVCTLFEDCLKASICDSLHPWKLVCSFVLVITIDLNDCERSELRLKPIFLYDGKDPLFSVIDADSTACLS